FDGIYETYVASEASHEVDFRTAPEREGAPIFPDAVLDSMQRLMMGFVRVREGRVELAFAPLASPLLEQALLTAVGVASSAARRPSPTIPLGKFEAPPTLPIHTSLVVGWVVIVIAGWVGGHWLAMTTAAIAWDSELLCGAPGRATVSDGAIACVDH